MTKRTFMSSRAMTLAFAGLLIAVSAGAAPTRATSRLVTPRTLYIEHGKIHKFAQDGARITWIGGRHYTVHLRSVTGRRTLAGRSSWVLGNAGPGAAVGAQSASTLALGGTRAVWVKYAGVMTREAAIYTSKPGQKKPAIIDTPSVSDYGGTYLTGLVASGETILYGDAIVKYDITGACSLTGGGVHRYLGKWYPPRIAGIPAAFRIATGGRLVAVVPAKVTDAQRCTWGAAPNGPVDVYNLSGRASGQGLPARNGPRSRAGLARPGGDRDTVGRIDRARTLLPRHGETPRRDDDARRFRPLDRQRESSFGSATPSTCGGWSQEAGRPVPVDRQTDRIDD